MVRDKALSALRGRYIFGDFCRGVIESARLRGTKARDVKATRLRVDSLSSFGVDARRRAYAVSLTARSSGSSRADRAGRWRITASSWSAPTTRARSP